MAIEQSAREVIAAAEAAYTAAKEAEQALGALMTRAIRVLLKPGTIIDLRSKENPEYLWVAKATAGNDRGSQRFRIDTPPVVVVSLSHPSLSKWQCTATPISEKTGKPMSGRGGNCHRNDVRLSGHLVREAATAQEELSGEDYHRREMAHLAQFIETAIAGEP